MLRKTLSSSDVKTGIVKKQKIRYPEVMEKWALVTGAAVRVGRECALYLAGRGYGLILHYFRSYEPVRELESLLQRQGTPTRTVACDFAQTDAVDRLWQAAAVPELQLIVNNAAVFVPDAPADASSETTRRQIRINYEVPFEIMRRVERELSGCTVINFLDGRLERSASQFYSYGLSKRMTEWATAAFAAATRENRYYGIAPKALLPPVIDGREPDNSRCYRVSGTAVLRPVFDTVLAGSAENGTVFTV